MEKRSVAGNSGSVVAIDEENLSVVVEKESESCVDPLKISDKLAIPAYLEQTYWWAYIHPAGVRFFERQWLVNLILWGNFSKLRDAALAEIDVPEHGRILQVACVYGDFTPRMLEILPKKATLDVVDVAPVQLHNLAAKLNGQTNIRLLHRDATNLSLESDRYDNVVVFFLLHEMPESVRLQTIQEVVRVVRPGGKLIFVDYHRPWAGNPFRYVMVPILKTLEPFALDIWDNEIVDWVPSDPPVRYVHKETYFGGLYQKVILIKG